MTEATELLFVYAMLLRPDLQADTFGRRVVSEPDVLPGYRLGYAEFALPQVAALSTSRQHPVALRTGDPRDKIVGEVLQVTLAELEAADEYASPGYRRAAATLASGARAWVYVHETPHGVAD
ncbi:gamma-glutamylcyclotransferase family protein [Microbacterium sp. GXF7504]